MNDLPTEVEDNEDVASASLTNNEESPKTDDTDKERDTLAGSVGSAIQKLNGDTKKLLELDVSDEVKDKIVNDYAGFGDAKNFEDYKKIVEKEKAELEIEEKKIEEKASAIKKAFGKLDEREFGKVNSTYDELTKKYPNMDKEDLIPLLKAKTQKPKKLKMPIVKKINKSSAKGLVFRKQTLADII